MGAINQSCPSQLPPGFLLWFLLSSSCFVHSSLLLPPSTYFLPVPLTIIVFPSSAAERAGRERERERKEVGERDKWHSSALTSWSLWSDCGRYILESLLFPWRQNENKLSADKNEKVTLKPSQSAWGVFLLSDRLFGKTDKHWTYCLTVCLSVCLSVSLSVSVSARLSVRLSGMPESYIETWLIWPTVALVSISVPDHPPLIITVWLIRSGQTFSM